MGRGDSKSRKGKIKQGSYGNSRPHKPNKGQSVVIAEPVKAKKVAKPAQEKEAVAPKAKKTAKKTTKTKETTEE